MKYVREEFAKAAECLDRAAEVDPKEWGPAGNCLFALQFQSDDPALLLAEHRAWDRKFVEPLKNEIQPFANQRRREGHRRTGEQHEREREQRADDPDRQVQVSKRQQPVDEWEHGAPCNAPEQHARATDRSDWTRARPPEVAMRKARELLGSNPSSQSTINAYRPDRH